jgi:diacylglycerol kinase family enzyme
MPSGHHPERYLRRRIGTRGAQRLAALGALALDLLGLALLARLVVVEPAWTISLVVLARAFMVLAFVALTSVGLRRRATVLGVAVVGVALVVGILFWQPDGDGPGWGGPSVLTALVVGTLLQRWAVQVPPPNSPKLFRVRPGEQPACARGVLFVNPHSGGGKAEAFDVAARARSLGVDVRVLEKGDDLVALARRAADEGADALGVASGDGSLAAVAQVAVERDLPFVCVPAGTRNHFALDLGLDRDDPCQALSAFVSGQERSIDYATVNDRMFLNNVALGVYAAIVEQPGYRDAKVETALSLLPELASDGGPWFDLRFDVPEHGRVESTALLMVSNGAYDLQGEFGRRPVLDGGQLGVLTLDPQHLGDLMSLTVLAAAGWAERSRALWAWSAPTFSVASEEGELSAGIDGETVRLATPLSFAAVPGGLRVLVPRGTRVGLREQHRSARGRYSGLFEVAFGAPARS